MAFSSRYLVCALFAVLLAYSFVSLGLFLPSKPGTIDVAQYWSAFQVWSLGGNPYSPEELFSLQNRLISPREEVVSMWNPPWLLLILSPILVWSFEWTCALWFIASLISATVAVSLILREIGALRRKDVYLLSATALTFYPFYSSLFLGQLGMFLLLGLSLFCCGWLRKEKSLLTCGTILLALKPHLFLFFAAFFLVSLAVSRWISGFLVVALTCLSLIALPTLIDHEIFVHWMNLFGHLQTDVFTPTQEWRTATLGTFLSVSTGLRGDWIKWIPLLAGLATLAIRIVLMGAPRATLYSILLASSLSIGLSPYGWLFDFSLLFLPQVLLLLKTSKKYLVVVLNLITIVFGAFVADVQDSFWWVPWSIVALLLIASPKLRVDDGSSAS